MHPLQWRHMGTIASQITSSRLCTHCLFRRRSKKTSKLRVTGLCEGNSPVTGDFPAQMASNAENVSIWWRHHAVAEGINILHVYEFCSKINNQTFNMLTGNTFQQWNGKYSIVLHIDLKTQMTTYMRPKQNGRHFADDIFKCTFLNENVWIPIKISLKFVPLGPINNIPSLVQILAWRRPGDKPLSRAMMVRLPTHICVTRPQWANVYLLLSVTYRGFGEKVSLNL